jgi:hypothetical protein
LFGRRSSRGRTRRDLLLGGRLRLNGTAKSLLVGLAADAVGLLLLDARGVALYPDPKLDAEVKRFFVG